MRTFNPFWGNNAANVRVFWARWAMNGASAPTAWIAGGQGMKLPTRTSAGLYSMVLVDAPGGILLNWDFGSRADVIANVMALYLLTWAPTTNTLTFTAAVPTSALTAADPPAAGANREFYCTLVFGQSENL